ncbi:MAG: acyl-CoA synthetase FdrA [Candidatus Ranarchaeia archaeon]
MPVKTIIEPNRYYDSVVLMNLSNTLRTLKGIEQAAVVMGTNFNKKFLLTTGLYTPKVNAAGPNDMVIAIRGKNKKDLEEALNKAKDLLRINKKIAEKREEIQTLSSALEALPDANLVLISLPGKYAALQAYKALNQDRNVLLFSNNVSIEDELQLKILAKKKHLLLMGPECGTAIINNIGLGFANAVRKGTIGIVGATGTGIQQVTTIIHNQGFGISQAIGTGGRDLSAKIGGIMTIEGLILLERDASTNVIVILSKPPAPSVERKILNTVKTLSKPVIVGILGGNETAIQNAGAIAATTLEDAAKKAIQLATQKKERAITPVQERITKPSVIRSEYEKLSNSQKYVRGLFTGGTLCYESLLILTDLLGNIHSNIPLRQELKLGEAKEGKGHACIDLGTKEFTSGRPHPMIDPTLRQQHILKEAKNKGTAVILLDVVIGYGAHHDPAGALAPVIQKSKVLTQRANRYLPFVASVIGTNQDIQNLQLQKQKLESTGVLVFSTNAMATRAAALIATRGAIKDKLDQFWSL